VGGGVGAVTARRNRPPDVFQPEVGERCLDTVEVDARFDRRRNVHVQMGDGSHQQQVAFDAVPARSQGGLDLRREVDDRLVDPGDTAVVTDQTCGDTRADARDPLQPVGRIASQGRQIDVLVRFDAVGAPDLLDVLDDQVGEGGLRTEEPGVGCHQRGEVTVATQQVATPLSVQAAVDGSSHEVVGFGALSFDDGEPAGREVGPQSHQTLA
jgi:hypothetical protein